MVNNWTNNADTSSIHKNYLIQLTILESLLMQGSIPLDRLAWIISRRLKGNGRITWNTTPQYIADRIAYLERFGWLTVEDGIAQITDKGVEALKNGSIHSITASTFFNWLSSYIGRLSLLISIVAILISILISIFVYYQQQQKDERDLKIQEQEKVIHQQEVEEIRLNRKLAQQKDSITMLVEARRYENELKLAKAKVEQDIKLKSLEQQK